MIRGELGGKRFLFGEKKVSRNFFGEWGRWSYSSILPKRERKKKFETEHSNENPPFFFERDLGKIFLIPFRPAGGGVFFFFFLVQREKKWVFDN